MDTLIWDQMDAAARTAALERAPQHRSAETRNTVADIIQQVQRRGDGALRELTARLDGVEAGSLSVGDADWKQAIGRLEPAVRQAIDAAFENIRVFHEAGKPRDMSLETAPGVVCRARYIGIDRVGLYAPGGQTPLPSSVLMMGVPARLAGCREIVLCTSPRQDGGVDSAIAYAASLCGVHSLFRIGGAQAIAAMALGTESVPACDKLFGPGSVWVTEAKRQVAASDLAVTIDMPAGPSEVLVVADDSADPTFVAADLLAQAEHGRDSQAILVTTDRELASQVLAQVEVLAASLSREAQIRASLQYSRVLIARDLRQAVEIANAYAAEHLIIQTRDPERLLGGVTAAGSVFLGAWTPEVLGDYCSGTNHVLPTCGFARSVNGLSVTDFMKRMTVQHATPSGLQNLADTALTLARREGLTAHALAVSVRQDAVAAGANDES